MPQVQVQTPGGGKVTVEAPEGASESDILEFAQQQYNQQKEGFLQFFGRGLAKGAKSTIAAGGSSEPPMPFEPPEQIQARQQLLPDVEATYPAPKTLKGRIAQGMGEGIANPQNLLGPAGPLRVLGRAAMGAAAGAGSEIGGYLTKDSVLGRLIGGIAGGAAGQAALRPLERGALRAATPTIPPERAPAVAELQRQGIEPSAGDALGSTTLQHLERLGDYWFGGGTYKTLKQETLGEFTSVAVQGMGERGNRLTPQMVQNVERRFEQRAQQAARDAPIRQDRQLGNELTAIEQDVFRFGHTDEVARRISALISHINTNFITRTRGARTIGEMGGESYQAITRYGESLGQAMRDTNPNIANFAGRIRTALDDALERTVDARVRSAFARGQRGGPAQQQAIAMATALNGLRQARREWYNMIVLSKSIAGPGEAAAEGLVLPERLRANLTQGQDNKLAYAAQRTDLQRLANAGTQIIEPYHPPGDIRRVVAPLVAAAGLFTGGLGVKSGAALFAPGALGRVVNSRAVQEYLKNQRTQNLTQQLMTWREAAARGGLIGAMSQPGQGGPPQIASPVSPMMLDRTRNQLAGGRGLPDISRQDAVLGVTAGAGGPGGGARGLGRAMSKFANKNEPGFWREAIGKVRRAIEGGKSIEAISKEMGVTSTVIDRAIKQYGGKDFPERPRSRVKYTDKDVARWAKWRKEGKTWAEIGKEEGISGIAAHQKAQRMGLIPYRSDPDWLKQELRSKLEKPSTYGGEDFA